MIAGMPRRLDAMTRFCKAFAVFASPSTGFEYVPSMNMVVMPPSPPGGIAMSFDGKLFRSCPSFSSSVILFMRSAARFSGDSAGF